MAVFVVILLLAFFLLPLPSPARPTTRQIAPTRMDTDLVFGAAFSLGEPETLTPSPHPLNLLCSFALRAARQFCLARNREESHPSLYESSS